MKSVVTNLRVPVESWESREEALERAKKQLKLTDEQLKDYRIIYVKVPEVKFNFREMGRIR